jgi:hypothetical protein
MKKKITAIRAGEFLSELVEDSKLYRMIHEPSFGKWSRQEKRIEESLEALMLFRVRQQTPCVLSLVREYKSGKIKKRHLEDALRAIEKFHFIFTSITSQRSSGGISAMYASLARRLTDAADTHSAVTVIHDLKSKLKERIPSLEEVKALMARVIFTNNATKQRALVRYILTAFYRHQNPAVPVAYESMTIEHLVPQSMIGRNGYDDGLIGQLGNLILVGEELNRKLNDKSFKDKKAILIGVGYPLRREIRQATEWTRVEIEKLTATMAEEAHGTIWRI